MIEVPGMNWSILNPEGNYADALQ